MENSDLAGDQLEGAAPIAVFMGWIRSDGSPNVRRVYYEAGRKRWPIYQMEDGRGSSRLRSSKSALKRYREDLIKQAEQEAARLRIATTASA